MPFSNQEENTLTSPTPVLPSTKGESLQLPENLSTHIQTSYFPMPFPPGKLQLTEQGRKNNHSLKEKTKHCR